MKGDTMDLFLSKRFLKRAIIFLIAVTAIFFMARWAYSADTVSENGTSVTLEWDANTESTLAGYNVFQAERIGDHSTAWTIHGTVGKDVTTYTITNVDVTKNWSWQITAFDESGNESRVSNMVELVDKTPPMPPPNLRKVTP